MRDPVIRATAMPSDTNPYGGVFGGWIFSLMGLGAGSAASRRVQGKAVLVAADELRFTGAPQVGDEVSVYAELRASGRTSLTYAVEAIARERHGETETRVASGLLKFVALDHQDRPRLVAEQEETHG
jgi:acyl-CoA thioesterase YciA